MLCADERRCELKTVGGLECRQAVLRYRRDWAGPGLRICLAVFGLSPLSAAFAVPPLAQQKPDDLAQVDISSDPGWADPLPLPPVGKSSARVAIGDGVQLLVIDTQTNVGDPDATYHHIALRFLNESGVHGASSVRVTFDPSYQSVVFHRLRLWRDGRSVDHLRDGVFRVLRREENLEQNLLDGRKTLLAVVEDVRVGDVLEYAYTVAGGNPIFGGRFVGNFIFRWTSPIVCNRVRVLLPEGRTIRRRLSGEGAAEPAERLVGGRREWLWDQTNTPPVQVEDALPLWYKSLPEAALSEFDSWADVADWAASCFCATGGIDEACVASLADWRRLPSKEERVEAALSFVQDEIRYFGVELGEGSHRPNPPGLVLQRRFGDCKDKAVLLCALLGRLGISARPVLVNTWLRGHIMDELPSALAFNHVIVAIQIGGGTVWVDPTMTHQRGSLYQRYMPDYGVALDIAEASKGLRPFSSGRLCEARTEARELYDLSVAGRPALLSVSTMLYGRDADYRRALFADSSRDEWDRQQLNYYAQRFPGIERRGAVTVEDDGRGDVVCTSERYAIQGIWHPDAEQTNRVTAGFTAQSLEPYVRQPCTVLRKAPLGLTFPLDVSQTMEIRLPSSWPVRPKKIDLKDDFMVFSYELEKAENILTLRFRLRTLRDAVPVADIPGHLQMRRKINGLLEFNLLDGNGEAKRFVFNWILAEITAGWCAVLAVLWIVGYRCRLRPLPLPYTPMEADAKEPFGIGGWLLLPCFGMVVGLCHSVGSLVRCKTYFDANTWHALTSPDSAAYHPFWLPVMVVETIIPLLFIALLSLNAVLMARRRASLPYLMIALYLVSVAAVVIDMSVGMQIPAVSEHLRAGEAVRVGLRAIVAACVWIPYFLCSRRVRNTFRS